MSIAFLQQRKVGIAIAFGGVKDDGNQERGQQFATITYQVLQDLGTRSTVFRPTSYFDPLFTYLYNSNQVIIDVYLVARPFATQETCDNNHQAVQGISECD